ncbi:MAG TPA: single-stranded DNA-binding protein [Thiotrichales bacterium]|nr:single-stranded DNA-binding protein [Thiotrichales bacterium]
MSTHFIGRGNLGNDPELKTVEVDGEKRKVAEMRVYFDRSVPAGDGYEDRGGFWMTVTLWGARAEACARLLAKGARVHCEGSLQRETWETEEGEERWDIRLRADYVALDLQRVDHIGWKTKDE